MEYGLMLSGVACLVMAYYSLRSVKKIVKKGLKTKAFITGFKSGYRNQSSYPVIQFSTLTGEEIKIKLSDPFQGEKKVQQVNIIYDPDDPHNAIIDDPFYLGRKYYWIGLVGILLLLAGIYLWLTPTVK